MLIFTLLKANSPLFFTIVQQQEGNFHPFTAAFFIAWLLFPQAARKTAADTVFLPLLGHLKKKGGLLFHCLVSTYLEMGEGGSFFILQWGCMYKSLMCQPVTLCPSPLPNKLHECTWQWEHSSHSGLSQWHQNGTKSFFSAGHSGTGWPLAGAQHSLPLDAGSALNHVLSHCWLLGKWNLLYIEKLDLLNTEWALTTFPGLCIFLCCQRWLHKAIAEDRACVVRVAQLRFYWDRIIVMPANPGEFKMKWWLWNRGPKSIAIKWMRTF